MRKQPFVQAAAAVLEKYCTGGCGRFSVYRVKHLRDDTTKGPVLYILYTS